MAESLQLTFSLHGALYSLDTSYAPFYDYARKYLTGLLENEDTFQVGHREPDISVHFYWNAVPSGDRLGGDTRQWGRRVLQTGQRILQTEVLPVPGLQIVANWNANCLELEAYYRPISRLGRWVQPLGSLREKLFVVLIFYLTYFPILYFLEQQRGWHLLHAAALALPQGGCLLAGLPGSGKSTFSLALLSAPNAQLLSDNLLLFDLENAYACPESIHLTQVSRDLLPKEVNEFLINTGRNFSHRRSDFHLAREARSWQVQPKLLIFLGLSHQFEYQPVPAPLAFKRLVALDQMAKEINAYNQFSAALNLIAPHPGPSLNYLATLEKLVSRLDCYEIWLEKGQNLQQAVQTVGQLIAGSAQSISED